MDGAYLLEGAAGRTTDTPAPRPTRPCPRRVHCIAPADDLVRLATTVYLLGRAEEADVRFDEVFRRAVSGGDVPHAVRAGL